MPPQQGYISQQFDRVEDGAKTPMATCKHCKDKKVAKNIVGRKIAHLAACDAYYTYLQALITQSTDVGNKELDQLPQELKDKIEARTGTALSSRPGQTPFAAATAGRDALKDELDTTVLKAIFGGGLPFDAFEADKHPAVLHLCQLVLPDYIPPTQTRIAQAMMDLSRQQDPAQTAPVQLPDPSPAQSPPQPPALPPTHPPALPPTHPPALPPTHPPALPPTHPPALPPTQPPAQPRAQQSGTITPRNLDPREGSYYTPGGTKRPFDLV